VLKRDHIEPAWAFCEHCDEVYSLQGWVYDSVTGKRVRCRKPGVSCVLPNHGHPQLTIGEYGQICSVCEPAWKALIKEANV
jgi:hypothetical protein